MSIDSAAVSDVSLDEILFNDVQMVLSQEAVLMQTITDYTSRGKSGTSNQFEIPRLSGLAVTDRREDGNEHSSGGMGMTVDIVPFDQHKIVPEYIYDLARERTELDLDDAFMELSPRRMSDNIEQAIWSELKKASAVTPDHIQQLTGAGNLVATIADLFKASRLLNEANVPFADRFAVVSPEIHEALMQYDAIQDASKSGGNSALITGQFAELAGFKLLMTNNAEANEMLCYHKSALAFGMKKSVTFEKERQASKERDYLSEKASYGRKVLDDGKRVVLFNSTGI